jgi:Asp-tRNA(Asn)/Glu-tRNA(Gln) amidotransferase C subunit
VWADDVPEAGLSVEDALRNAPEKRDNMFVVPRVVE